MLRNVVKSTFAVNIFKFSDLTTYDSLSRSTDTEKKVDVSVVQNESGWDRVKLMFESNEYGEASNELLTIMHVGAMSLFVGACYGGIIHSRVAYMNFIKNNQATAFVDHLEAKKKLQDAVTKSFGRGAWKWAWRLSLFCTSFVGISTTISVYRGKSGILEYVGAGIISGALYKFNAGPRGWIVGGGLGSVLGLIAGGATVGLLSLSGMTMDEVRYWQYHWRKERQSYLHKGMADYLAKEEEGVIREYDQKMGDAGKTLEDLGKKNENVKK